MQVLLNSFYTIYHGDNVAFHSTISNGKVRCLMLAMVGGIGGPPVHPREIIPLTSSLLKMCLYVLLQGVLLVACNVKVNVMLSESWC